MYYDKNKLPTAGTLVNVKLQPRSIQVREYFDSGQGYATYRAKDAKEAKKIAENIVKRKEQAGEPYRVQIVTEGAIVTYRNKED